MVDSSQKFSKTFYSSKQPSLPVSQVIGSKKDYRKQLRAGSRGDPTQKSLDSSQFSEILQLFQFNLFNPMIDENLLASQLKVEAIHIQDEINKVDTDGSLRAAQGIGFGKPYINQIKKWLASNGSINAKDLIDARVQTPIETEKILEILNVKSESEGIRKLFKFLSIIDVMASKIAEFEMITFLKYEENFASLVKKPIPSTSPIHSLNAGIQLNRFQTSQINLERNIELFNLANKLSTQQKTTTATQNAAKIDVAKISSLEELITSIDQNLLSLPEDSSELILNYLTNYQQLQPKYEKLKQKYKTSLKDFQKQEQNQQENIPKEAKLDEKSQKDPNFYLKLIDEVTKVTLSPNQYYQQQFEENKNNLETLCQKLSQQYSDLQIQHQRLQQQFQQQSKEIMDIAKQKEKLQLSAQHSYQGSKEYVEGYEEAMREELQDMKKGYEELIEQLHENIDKIKKDKAQELLDMKRDLNRENETKRLLLKKLNLFIKI